MHLAEGPQDLKHIEEALILAKAAAETGARARAEAAGAAGEVVVSLSEAIDEVPVGPNKK